MSSVPSAASSVVLVVDQLNRPAPGGIGTYVRALIDGLHTLVDVHELDASSITLYAGAGRSLDDLGFSLERSKFSSRVLARLWASGIDRVGSADGLVHALSLAQPPTRAGLVVTVHDLGWRAIPDAYGAHGIKWHEARLSDARRHAAAIVVPSDQVRDAVVDAGFVADRVVVIEHGSDHLPTPDFAATEELLQGLGLSDGYLLSVGTLEPRKNLRGLFGAYRVARAELTRDRPLLVVGPPGWGQELGPLPDGVVLVGPVAGGVLAGLYARARALLYVPFLEGYGLPVVEAMRAGAPVICSPVPSAGNAAFIVDPSDGDAISAAIRAVGDDDDLYADLRARGIAYVQEKTWANSARAHLELWRSLARRI